MVICESWHHLGEKLSRKILARRPNDHISHIRRRLMWSYMKSSILSIHYSYCADSFLGIFMFRTRYIHGYKGDDIKLFQKVKGILNVLLMHISVCKDHRHTVLETLFWDQMGAVSLEAVASASASLALATSLPVGPRQALVKHWTAGTTTNKAPERMMLAPPTPKVKYHWWVASYR